MENLFTQVDFIATPVTRSGAPKSDPMDYKCNLYYIVEFKVFRNLGF